jgi:hypothetical protein
MICLGRCNNVPGSQPLAEAGSPADLIETPKPSLELYLRKN